MIVLTAAAVALAADVGSKAAVIGDGRVRVLLNRRAPISVARASALLALVTVVVLAAAPTGLTAAGLGLAIGGAAGNVRGNRGHPGESWP